MRYRHEQLLRRIEDAQRRLNATVARLGDEEAAAPSLLPGWTRGHVLTHIARNADGLANVLRWARTGVVTPMYASQEARDSEIEAGAGRTAAVLAADVRESAATFADEAARMPSGAWTAQVRRTLTSEPFPASDTLLRRLGEVEIHHVDLAAGYGYRDWPPEFVAGILPAVAGSLRGRGDAPPCRVTAAGQDRAYVIGDEDAEAPALISGAPGAVLAWLLGRHAGEDLGLRHAGPLPVLPPWR